MAKERVSRAFKHNIPPAADATFNQRDHLFVLRGKQVDRRIARAQRIVQILSILDVAISFCAGVAGVSNVHEFLGSPSRSFGLISAVAHIIRGITDKVIHIWEQSREAFGMSPNPTSGSVMLSSISRSENISFCGVTLSDLGD